MVALDVVMLIILLLSVLIGLWRGLMYEVIVVAGWVAAFILAPIYSVDVAVLLPADSLSTAVRLAIGFLLVFVAVVFAGGLVAWLVQRRIDLSRRVLLFGLGWLPAQEAAKQGLGALLAGAVLPASAHAADPPPGAAISSNLEYVTRIAGANGITEGKFDEVRGKDVLVITGRGVARGGALRDLPHCGRERQRRPGRLPWRRRPP